MAESEEELKSPLMKMKVESEKVGLKLNIQKTSSLFFSLYNSMNTSEQSSCGVHIRKRLLASLLSPLLIPPHLIQVTAISLFPLLFSM